MALFIKECKYILKTPANLIYIFFVGLFFFSVYVPDVGADNYLPPQSGETAQSAPGMFVNPLGEYRAVPDGDDNKTIAIGVSTLLNEFIPNKFDASFLGGSKIISLNERDKQKVYEILERICGKEILEKALSSEMQEGAYSFDKITEYPQVRMFILSCQFDISINEFNKLMREVGKIVGGQNKYQSPEDFVSKKQATYDEAMEYYNEIITENLFGKEKLTGGLARLFADRMSVISLLLGAIVAVFYFFRAGKSNETLYPKRISSMKIILIKYMALLTALLLPIILFGAAALVQAAQIAAQYGVSIDVFAFVKITVAWVLPSIMISASTAMLITLLTDTPIAVFAWLVIWFLQTATPPFIGSYGIDRMMIRFNTVLKYDLFQLVRTEIIVNRVFYTVLSFLFVLLTIWIYELKRGGILNVKNIWKRILQKH